MFSHNRWAHGPLVNALGTVATQTRLPLCVPVHTRRLLEGVQDGVRVCLYKAILEIILLRIVVASCNLLNAELVLGRRAEVSWGWVVPGSVCIKVPGRLVLSEVQLEGELLLVVVSAECLLHGGASIASVLEVDLGWHLGRLTTFTPHQHFLEFRAFRQQLS